MAAIKAYTDIEQSKKLAKILPLESADMCYEYIGKLNAEYRGTPINAHALDDDLPCWSLAALLGVLPKIGSEEPMIQKYYYANNPTERYICIYNLTDMTNEYGNPVDACYEMICWLKENNLL